MKKNRDLDLNRKIELLYSYINFLLNENKKISQELENTQLLNDKLINELKVIHSDYDKGDVSSISDVPILDFPFLS